MQPTPATDRRWFALSATGDIMPLGRHLNFEGADEAATVKNVSAVWIVDEAGLRVWKTQINVALKGHIDA